MVLQGQAYKILLLKDYLHIRRQALDAASVALEPTWISQQQQTADDKAEMVN
jgi:hypothetical protein